MDLHFHGPEPTAAEQAAVDSVLGPPTSAWAGGPRNMEEEGHSLPAGRPRGPIPPRPPPARAPCRPVAVRLDPAGRPRLYLPAPDRAPRRGPRRRHVLSPLLARAATPGRRPRVRRHRLPDQGGGASLRRAGACARAGERRPLETKPVPGPLRTGSGRVDSECGRVAECDLAGSGDNRGHRGRAGLERRRLHDGFESLRQSVPQFGSPTLRLLGRIGRIDPESLDGLSRLGRLLRTGSGDRDRPGGGHSRGPGLQAHGPRRCGVSDGPQVGRRGESAGPAPLRGLQRRRVGARHLQGSRPDGGRSVRGDRGDDDRRLRDRERARVSLRARGVSRSRPAGWARRSPRPAPPACSARTS